MAPPPSAGHLEATNSPLPQLIFNSSLELVSINTAATRIFGPPPPNTVNKASSYLCRGDGEQESTSLLTSSTPSSDGIEQSGDFGTRALLVRLAKDCQELQWGDTVSLEYWTTLKDGARTTNKADALVQIDLLPSGETTYTVLLLRPHATPSPPTTQRTVSPRHTAASSVGSGSYKSISSTSGDSSAPNSQRRTIDISTPQYTATNKTLEEARPLDDILKTIVAPPTETTAPTLKRLNSVESMAVLETMPVMLIHADKSGRTDWFNASWYEYTGLSEGDSTDYVKWSSLFMEEDLKYVLPLWSENVARGTPFQFEYRVRGSDGVMRWHLCRAKATMDTDGKPLSWSCTVTDVEDLVQIRSEALQVREHVRAVLSGANIVLLSIDRQGTITLFEGEASVAHALGGGDVDSPVEIGAALATVWRDRRLHEAVEQILSGEKSQVTAFLESQYGDNGLKWCRYRLVPLLGNTVDSSQDITGVIIVAADVTDMVNTEQELQMAQHEKALLQASESAAKEANELKTNFLTSISHEIRTPIAAILGICELLLSDNSMAEMHSSLIRKALRSGEILLDLIGMVLDVRKIESESLVLEECPFELEQTIADARLFSILAHKKELTFLEDIGHYYEAPLMGDRLRLQQVLANALSNSVKFTKTGGITLKMRQERETDSHVYVCFEVQDSGIGIAEDVLPTLFEPFRQADASTARHFGGSGLGLHIARKLVELMGGSVELTSTFGKGTTMTIRVPLKKAPLESLSTLSDSIASIEQQEAETRRPPRESVRILLAEDNDLIREIVTKTVQKMKFQIDAVEDGNAAVAAVHAKNYDVVLMDGQMPGLDGYQATAQIRQSNDEAVRRLKIIALTASAIQGDRERCIEAGMDSYLAKPVRAEALERAIWDAVTPPAPRKE